jgi:hypothetical protein
MGRDQHKVDTIFKEWRSKINVKYLEKKKKKKQFFAKEKYLKYLDLPERRNFV